MEAIKFLWCYPLPMALAIVAAKLLVILIGVHLLRE